MRRNFGKNWFDGANGKGCAHAGAFVCCKVADSNEFSAL
jgi:hypothetical protein